MHARLWIRILSSSAQLEILTHVRACNILYFILTECICWKSLKLSIFPNIQLCLKMDPAERPTCSVLLKHDFFKKDNFSEKFAQELKAKITRETAENPLLRRHDSRDESAEEKAKRKEKKKKV